MIDMTHKPITTALIATLAAVAFATPASAAPDTSEPSPDTTDHEACIPQGVEVIDSVTGNSYIYGIPVELGYDTCGQPIPDICVQWPDGHYSSLWTVYDCTPEPAETIAATPAVTTTTTPVEAVSAPTLPATGGEAWLAVIAGLALFAGLSLIRWARS